MIELFRRSVSGLRTHSRLSLVLVFSVFIPILFITFYVSESRSTEADLATVLLKKISTTHDAVEALLIAEGDLTYFAETILSEQDDTERLDLVIKEDDVFSVVYSTASIPEGTVIESVANFQSSLIEPGSTYVFQYLINGELREHAYRAIPSVAGEQYFVFTEHNFTPLYELMKARGDRPLALLAILLVLMLVVAYWMARQVNYELLYKTTREALTERDVFMSSLVHELRAPLTAMRGYASMIEESTAVPIVEREFATKIRLSTGRLVTLVNDFLEAARIQSGQLPLTFARTNAGELLERVEAAAHLSAQEKGLVLALRLPNETIEFTTDSKRLEQVLTNMLSNAIKYTPKGSVTLSLQREFRQVIFTIADTGAGISAEDQRKLFTPFVRVGDAAQKEQVTGTGLGMWITRQLVTQLGGTIELESIKDVGTHVIMKFPIERKNS